MVAFPGTLFLYSSFRAERSKIQINILTSKANTKKQSLVYDVESIIPRSLTYKIYLKADLNTFHMI